MKARINLLFALMIYGFGTLSLLAVDLLITRYFDKSTAASWAQLKSFMMILGPALIIGANNLVVRSPERSTQIAKTTLLGLIATSLLLAVVAIFFSHTVPQWLIPVCIAYAVGLYLSSLYRGRLEIVRAQAAQNLWKIGLLLLICILIELKFKTLSIGSLALFALTAMTALCAVKSLKGLREFTKEIFASEYITGDEFFFSIKYMISGFTAAASAYLEIAILSTFVTPLILTNYFTHYTMFNGVAVFFSGYVGFVLTPNVRAQPGKWGGLINRRFLLIAIACLLSTALLAYPLTSIYGLYFKNHANIALVCLMTFTSALRMLYVFPTSYMGAMARSSELDGFIISGCLGLGLFAGGFFALKYLGMNVVIAICIASAFNWSYRVYSAIIYSRKIYSREELVV